MRARGRLIAAKDNNDDGVDEKTLRLTLIAPDTLEYDRESRIISPSVYFTASAELDNTIAEARSLGARALRWDPSSVLGPALQEVVR